MSSHELKFSSSTQPFELRLNEIAATHIAAHWRGYKARFIGGCVTMAQFHTRRDVWRAKVVLHPGLSTRPGALLLDWFEATVMDWRSAKPLLWYCAAYRLPCCWFHYDLSASDTDSESDMSVSDSDLDELD